MTAVEIQRRSSKIIGKRIQLLRNSNNMSQRTLGEKLKKHAITIQRYESGKIRVPMYVVDKIAQMLNVSPISIIEVDINQILKAAESEE